MKLRLNNVWIEVIDAPEPAVDLLDRVLSYPVPGSEWSALHEAGIWDGRRHLFSRKRSVFGSGLYGYAAQALIQAGIPFAVEDARVFPPRTDDVPEFFVRPPDGHSWRAWQRLAIDRALQYGRGVVNAPPRSGKTRVGVAVVAQLGLRTLWIAPTKSIVEQTAAVFVESGIPTEYVGVVAGERREMDRRFTIATAASAVTFSKPWMEGVRTLVLDEHHHASADSWQQISRRCSNACYRYGMTGTFFRVDGTDMLMHSILAHELIRVTVSDLVAQKQLARALVVCQGVAGKKVRAANWQLAKKLGITRHEERNRWILAWAKKLLGAHQNVLILVDEKEHGRLLRDRIPGSEFVCSENSTDQIARFNAGEIRVLIGTSILGEGVDLPGAASLIYARSGAAESVVWQSIFRVLTASGGKEAATIVDFIDHQHRVLHRWSQERVHLYRSEPSFTIRILEASYADPGLPLS